MSQTLEQILKDVNAFVDLDYTLPTDTELETRSSFANQAVRDAADIAQLSELQKVYEVDPGASVTVPLPADFREFSTNPHQLVGSTWKEFVEILPKERYSKSPSDPYCYVLGNAKNGYVAIFNGHEANATLSFTYQSFPTGMLTLSDKCELASSTYVVAKTESYILQSRGDDRFPFVDKTANSKLRNMVGRGEKTPGGQVQSVPMGFRNPLS